MTGNNGRAVLDVEEALCSDDMLPLYIDCDVREVDEAEFCAGTWNTIPFDVKIKT